MHRMQLIIKFLFWRENRQKGIIVVQNVGSEQAECGVQFLQELQPNKMI